jgi:mannose-1-phosphate guanylyltransferase
MARGCLWNSFVMVGRVTAFLGSIRQTLPGLLDAFESIRSSFSTTSEAAALRRLYSGISSTSFSQEVMSMRPNDLGVLCATGLGWSDLGEPGRVLSLLERGGVETEWGFKPGLKLDQAVARTLTAR